MLIFLGWCNAAYDVANSRNKKVVWLNMDETMIAYGYANKRGTVVNPAVWDDVNACLLSDGLDKALTRTNMSWMACICDDYVVQQCLPQVLKAKEKVFPQWLQDVAHHLMPENACILLDQSVWNTQETFEQYLHHLHAAIEPFMGGRVFILVVDASKTHISDSIAEAARRLNMILVLIPGQLTWLLQPLDVYVFGNLKNRLRDTLQALREAQPDGQLKKEEWLAAVLQEVRSLNLGDHWKPFARLGMDGSQKNMRLVDDEVVEQAAVDANPRRIPTPEQLADCLGRVHVPFYTLLMRPYDASRPRIDLGLPSRSSGTRSNGTQ